MRKPNRLLVFKAWMLPLIVAGLVLPGTAGILIAGPGLGLALGQLCAVVIICFAAVKKPDEPIEVAVAADQHRRLLVLAMETVEDSDAVERIAAIAHDDPVEPAEVLVLAPATNGSVSHWLSDVDGARDTAQVRLVHSLASLAAAGVDARGRIGDTEPIQAVEDALRWFAADEVMLVCSPPDRSRSTPALRSELDRRLRVPFEAFECAERELDDAGRLSSAAGRSPRS